MVRVGKHGKDIFHPVPCKVLKHQLNRMRVEISSEDKGCT